jgi:hypothetical protein
MLTKNFISKKYATPKENLKPKHKGTQGQSIRSI